MIETTRIDGFPSSDARPHCRTVMLCSHGIPIALSVWHCHEQASTILFYPGTMASPLMYTLLLEELWRQGLNVVGLHPLSHGNSPRIKKSFTFEDILCNGLDAARWAQEHYCGPLIVSGHSQGGILALAHATRDTSIGAAFPLCTLLPHMAGASMVTRFHRFERYKRLFQASLRSLAVLFPRLPFPFCAYLSVKKAAAGHQQVYAPQRYLRWSYPISFVSSLINLELLDATRPGVINCPLVLFTAQDDALFPLSFMRETIDNIVAPYKKLEVLSGGGHTFAMSKIYVPQLAARMAEYCAALGLPLHSNVMKNSLSAPE